MDPDATLLRLFDALAAQDSDEALDALVDLANWIAGGGFLPGDPREEVSP